MDQPIDPDRQPYGTWYTGPGGLDFTRDDHAHAEAASERLAALREKPGDEPPYSHARIVFILGMIGFMHVPITVFQFLIKGVVMGFDRVDTWSALIFLPIAGIFFVLAAVAHFRPPQRGALPMFKAFLRGAIGISRGTAYRMLLKSDREREHDRVPPPCMANKPADPEPLPFNEQGKFERYWINAFGGGWHPYKTTSFRRVRMAELAPDLVVIDADVRVTNRSLVAHLWAFAPLFIGVVLTGLATVVVGSLLASKTVSAERSGLAIVIVMAPMALAILAAVILTIRSLIPIARREFPVRKLLVKVNGQWRVFSGELQAIEETDIRWALEPQKGPAHAD